MTVEAFAPAKVNLTLHVTGQRADGYHLLDSLVVFADAGDHLALTPADEMSIMVTGSFAKGVPADRRNLVWQAAELAGWTGHIALEKNIPHGAGLGGGSADAAAVLRALGVTENAGLLGADVPVCLGATAQRMQGIGGDLTVLPDLPPLAAVLVNPGVHVPTPSVFGGLTQKNNPAMPAEIPAFKSGRELLSWLADMRNDLEPPAIAQQPVIAEVLRALSVQNALLVRMSGSGSTCFALYDDPGIAEVMARDLAQRHPEWWVRDCRLS